MEENWQKIREFSRVDANIPLEIKLIPKEEKPHIKSRTSSAPFLYTPVDEPSDKTLAEWIKLINAKLDYLINIFSLHQEGFSQLPVRRVNISGGGMRFTSEQFFNIGDIVELKTVLETPAQVALYLYGEVVNVEKVDKNFLIFVKFINIDEDVRDYIIRFVFHRQRQIIRQKREI